MENTYKLYKPYEMQIKSKKNKILLSIRLRYVVVFYQKEEIYEQTRIRIEEKTFRHWKESE